MSYKDKLSPWCIIRPMSDVQMRIVRRFRRRVDAEGHLKILKQLIPNVPFEIMFDITSEHTDSEDLTPPTPLPWEDTAGELGVRPLIGVRAMSKKIQKVELFVVWWYDTASQKLLESTRRNSTSSACVIPKRKCVHENVR